MVSDATIREKKLQKIIELEKVLSQIQDTDVLLERILTEARAIVHADAGSIYVHEDGMLKIRYAQNETQRRRLAPGQKLPFNFFSFKVDEKSICGYSVLTGKILNVPDVYDIEGMPFVFNNESDFGEEIPVDDILETIHHFRAIDYVIDIAEDKLTEDIIKHLHYILKHDTKDSDLEWFAVGDYKKRANVVGGRKTSKPSEVHKHMQALLNEYIAKDIVTIDDIIAFHAEFEYIHPFQDGNGRVGRLIALKECLHHNVMPFIIEDVKKNFYYRGLAEWKNEKGWLMDTCRDGQDTFVKLLDMLEIPYG